MKITINIDKNAEETGDFTLHELTDDLQKIISQLQNQNFKLIASKNEQKYQLDFDKITSIYAQNKKVYLHMDDQQEFTVAYSLSALTEKLPPHFLRISASEIVNANKISHFEFTFGGKIKIFFTTSGYTYSSRSYLKNIKEYFGL